MISLSAVSRPFVLLSVAFLLQDEIMVSSVCVCLKCECVCVRVILCMSAGRLSYVCAHVFTLCICQDVSIYVYKPVCLVDYS